ncbi:MAG: metal dependent phosphohydrolase, partial [Actinomycetia bacterium]|nr:metal dependent phosphohydrolase [Actinomycetes bacterium]
MTEVIAGIEIPPTRLVSDATAFVRDTENDLLFNHSRRVFLFGSLQGKRRGLKPDPELLYMGALFHDVGLTPDHRTDDRRFEVDSANAARQFLRDHDVPEGDVARVWLS